MLRAPRADRAQVATATIELTLVAENAAQRDEWLAKIHEARQQVRLRVCGLVRPTWQPADVACSAGRCAEPFAEDRRRWLTRVRAGACA